MNKLEKKYKIAIIVLAITLIASIIVATSYAYWQITQYQTGANTINTGCLNVEFEELGTDIKLENAFPITNKEGFQTEPYTFKITNNCTLDASYSVTLNTVVPNTLSDNSVKAAIGTDTGLARKLTDYNINVDTSNIDMADLDTSYIIKTGFLLAGESITYNVRLWIDEDTNMNEMSKVFISKIYITNVVSEFATLKNETIIGSDTSAFLSGTINRGSIESLTFTNSNVVPNNAIGFWDVGTIKDGTVLAWYTDIDNNNLYEVYIGQEGGVIANEDSRYIFTYLTKLKTLDLMHFNTSRVTNMQTMFQYIPLSTLDLSTFDTSRVTNMLGMFGHNLELKTINVSSFDTSNVTNMSHMFRNLPKLESINLENFNTSNVTNMGAMFSGCSSLTSLDLSNFDTSNVITFSTPTSGGSPGMFGGCTSLIELDLSSFNTSKVTDMTYMFSGCSNLQKLNLSSFDTSNVNNMAQMFAYDSALVNLDLSSFNTSKVTNFGKMFYKCTNLVNLNVKSFTGDEVTQLRGMFRECSNLTSLDLSNFNTPKLTEIAYNESGTIYGFLQSCNNLRTINISKMTFDKVTSITTNAFDFPNNATVYLKDQAALDYVYAIKRGATSLQNCEEQSCPN